MKIRRDIDIPNITESELARIRENRKIIAERRAQINDRKVFGRRNLSIDECLEIMNNTNLH